MPLAESQSAMGTFRPFVHHFFKSRDPVAIPRTVYHIGEEYRLYTLPRWGCLTFLCISDSPFDERQAFSFLLEFFIQFKSEFRPLVTSYQRGDAAPVRYELNSSLLPFLSHTLLRHNTTKIEDYDLVVFSLDDDAEADADEEGRDGTGGGRPSSLSLRSKVPLLVQHAPAQASKSWKTQKQQRGAGSMNPVSAWLLRHPYLTIGFCIFVGVGLLLYFLVIVPLCGPRLEKRVDNNPESAFVCWFSTSNSSDFQPTVLAPSSNHTLAVPIQSVNNTGAMV